MRLAPILSASLLAAAASAASGPDRGVARFLEGPRPAGKLSHVSRPPSNPPPAAPVATLPPARDPQVEPPPPTPPAKPVEDSAKDTSSAASAPAESLSSLRSGTLEATRPEAGAPGEPAIFVSLELEAEEADTLRDAVAGLGAATAFRPDTRFAPRPSGPGSMLVSGWLPTSRLGELVTSRGVRRVSVAPRPRPAPGPEAAMGEFKLVLLADPMRPRESAAETAHALSAATGLVYGAPREPRKLADGRLAVDVYGRLPLARLSRALGMPGVLDIEPIAAAAARATEPMPAAGQEGGRSRAGFLKYMLDQGAWLIVLTLLLALPSFGKLVGKVLTVFVPYR